jgi:two-component system chemotaxis response regulator CheB
MQKVLIVDDSALMRRQLSKLFEAAGDFEVRFARNGTEALLENLEFSPDVVTLDINMPEMDGLTALAMMMEQRPVPVIMVSSLTEKGALATFEALALGALDYVAKPDGTISLSIDKIGDELLAKVRAATRSKLRSLRPQRPRVEQARPAGKLKPTVRPSALTRPVAPDRPTIPNMPSVWNKPAASGKSAASPQSKLVSQASHDGVVLIGVSTGGPRTLDEILPCLPADFPWPVLVAQHMPSSFTLPFANRMNDICQMQVVEAGYPTVLEAGTIYIGKGGADMVISLRNGRLVVLPKPESSLHLWHPSVELLGRTALEHCDPGQIIGVMLTGMGYDGADAFTEIRRRGGRTIAESEETAVVYGMPAELIARNGASLVLPDYKVAHQLIAWAARI